DLGLEAPPLLPGAAGAAVQALDLVDAVDHTLERALAVFPDRKRLSLGVRRLLGWLERFEGATWEQRGLASGAGLAPRAGRVVVGGAAGDARSAEAGGEGADGGPGAAALLRLAARLQGWRAPAATHAHDQRARRAGAVGGAACLPGRARAAPGRRRGVPV